MSRLLAFQESLWNAAKSAAIAGQFSRAIQHLQPLLGEPAESNYRELSHRLAGRIYSAQERYRLARKMFWAVLTLNRECARTWYDLGLVYEKDLYGSDEKAVRCYRRALARDPESAAIRAALGRGLVRINRVASGVRYLMRASRAADAATLKVIISGLLEADQPRRAWSVLRRLNFDLQRDPSVQALRGQVRYALMAQSQARRRDRHNDSTTCRVVPFLRIVTSSPQRAPGGPILRFDRPTSARPLTLQNRRG